jgi:steroid delta-isomerase-like uncharacterized protein
MTAIEIGVRALQALAAGTMDELERLYAPDFVCHTATDSPPGHAGLRERAMLIGGALYDTRLQVRADLAGAETVVCRWTGTGVHKGDLLGRRATGDHVTLSGVTIFRVRQGLIVEEWTEFDGAGLARQLPRALPRATAPQPRSAPERSQALTGTDGP